MDTWNGSFSTEVILLGLTENSQMKIVVFVVFSFIYLFAVSENIILITVCVIESRLHKPMYLFIINLSFVDILYSSVFVPNMLVHVFMDRWSISFSGCAAQMFVYLVLMATESVLLSVMAFDRYVAICFPLHYTNIMTSSACTKMWAGSWITGFLLAFPVAVTSLQMPLCGCTVNHFFCEVISLINMACNKFIAELVLFVLTIIAGLIPFIIFLLSYIHIIIAILRIHTSDGRKKAFSTCASHLINVSIIYTTSIIIYMKPVQKRSANAEKMISVFYTVGPPLWNPIIYSLRNKEIKMALQNLKRR